MRRDRFVTRLKKQPIGSYSAPRQFYYCRICTYHTLRLTRAYAHSQLHGPWEECGSAAAAYELRLSALAGRAGRRRVSSSPSALVTQAL